MLLCLHKLLQTAALSLKTEEADKAFTVTRSKANCITDIFFLKYHLDLELLRLTSWEFASDYF